MPNIQPKPKKLTEPEWRALCAQWEGDKRTQKQFCVDNNVNYAHFVSWRSKLRSECGQSRAKRFKPVVVKPVALPSNQRALVLRVPNGVTLQIPNGIHKTTSSMTLEVLRVKPC